MSRPPINAPSPHKKNTSRTDFDDDTKMRADVVSPSEAKAAVRIFEDAKHAAPTSSVNIRDHDRRLGHNSALLNTGGLLRTLDDIRQRNITVADITVPRIVVYGTQSAGKSSLLSRLARFQFPSRKDCCTSCPIEVMLRRRPNQPFEIEVKCESELPIVKKIMQNKPRMVFNSAGSAEERLGQLVDGIRESERAKSARSDENVGDSAYIHDEPIYLTIYRPEEDAVDLTLIDLPGINAKTKYQARVRDIVSPFVLEPDTIVLHVVRASQDTDNDATVMELEESTSEEEVKARLAKTIFVLTQIDHSDGGKHFGETALKLRNRLNKLAKKVRLDDGASVFFVRNRSPNDPETWSASDVDECEDTFFSTPEWDVVSDFTGRECLLAALEHRLHEKIKTAAPIIYKQLLHALSQAEDRLSEFTKKHPAEISADDELVEKVVHKAFTKAVRAYTDILRPLTTTGVTATYLDQRDQFIVECEAAMLELIDGLQAQKPKVRSDIFLHKVVKLNKRIVRNQPDNKERPDLWMKVVQEQIEDWTEELTSLGEKIHLLVQRLLNRLTLQLASYRQVKTMVCAEIERRMSDYFTQLQSDIQQLKNDAVCAVGVLEHKSWARKVDEEAEKLWVQYLLEEEPVFQLIRKTLTEEDQHVWKEKLEVIVSRHIGDTGRCVFKLHDPQIVVDLIMKCAESSKVAPKAQTERKDSDVADAAGPSQQLKWAGDSRRLLRLMLEQIACEKPDSTPLLFFRTRAAFEVYWEKAFQVVHAVVARVYSSSLKFLSSFGSDGDSEETFPKLIRLRFLEARAEDPTLKLDRGTVERDRQALIRERDLLDVWARALRSCV